MALGGVAARSTSNDSVYDPSTGQWVKKQQPRSPLENQYKVYENAIQQDAGDRSGIMGAYQKILGDIGNQPQLKAQEVNPEQLTYQSSPDLNDAVSNLRNLSETGGYSEGDVSNIRARGLSPIRATYANALREMDRRGRLSGSQSANYNASRAKMAREQSSILADKNIDLEAGIAQDRVSNKMAASPQWAAFSQNMNNQQNAVNQQNVTNRNDAQKFNSQQQLSAAGMNQQNKSQQLQAVGGMANVYGQTPGLSSVYGSHALQSAGQEQQKKQQQTNSGMDYLRSVMGLV